MKDKEFAIEKNILDLEHSENLSRGITELSIATGGFMAIILSLTNKSLIVAMIVASLFALMFLIDGLSKLSNCIKIKDKIRRLVEDYGD